MVCKDLEVKRVLQDVTGEELNGGATIALDARLDIAGRGRGRLSLM